MAPGPKMPRFLLTPRPLTAQSEKWSTPQLSSCDESGEKANAMTLSGPDATFALSAASRQL